MAWLLDTNIISEVRKGDRCSDRVRDWYYAQDEDDFHLSVLVLGEVRLGIENVRGRDLPKARGLERWLHQVEVAFGPRILPITAEICDLWGRLSIRQRMPAVDGFHAATAIHHRLTLVTHNKAAVARSGVDCFDPFVD